MDYIQQSQSSFTKHQQRQYNDHRKSTKVKIKKSSMASSTLCCRRVSFSMALMFILIELLLIINLSHGAKSFYLHWNTTNPM